MPIGESPKRKIFVVTSGVMRCLKRLSQQLGGFAVAAVLEEASSVAPRHRVEGPAHRLYERLVGACPSPPQRRLELGEGLLYGVKIGGVGR